MIPKIKAKTWMTTLEPLNKIASAAPKPAPLDTPSKSEDTKGFLNIPWNAVPAIESEAPTKMAAKILGSLICHTIVFTVDETVNCGNIGLKIVFTTSTGLIGYLPIKKDAKKRIIGKNTRSTILIISLFSLFIKSSYKFDSLSPESSKICFAWSSDKS